MTARPHDAGQFLRCGFTLSHLREVVEGPEAESRVEAAGLPSREIAGVCLNNLADAALGVCGVHLLASDLQHFRREVRQGHSVPAFCKRDRVATRSASNVEDRRVTCQM